MRLRPLPVLALLTVALGARAADTAAPAWKPFELGVHQRTVSTTSAAAQKAFDQGLLWSFAFNHDEAERAFREAARLDPDLAMAWWGIALVNGPHINNPEMDEAHAKAAWDALGEARARAAGASPVEKALIEALGVALCDAPSRGPQAAERGLREGDAGRLRALPEGRRRRRARGRSPHGRAAVGPVDARRPGAARHARDARGDRGRAHPEPAPPARAPPQDPRPGGFAPARRRGRRRRRPRAARAGLEPPRPHAVAHLRARRALGRRRGRERARDRGGRALQRADPVARASTGSTRPTTSIS